MEAKVLGLGILEPLFGFERARLEEISRAHPDINSWLVSRDIREAHVAEKEIRGSLLFQNLAGTLQVRDIIDDGCIRLVISFFETGGWLHTAPPLILVLLKEFVENGEEQFSLILFDGGYRVKAIDWAGRVFDTLEADGSTSESTRNEPISFDMAAAYRKYRAHHEEHPMAWGIKCGLYYFGSGVENISALRIIALREHLSLIPCNSSSRPFSTSDIMRVLTELEEDTGVEKEIFDQVLMKYREEFGRHLSMGKKMKKKTITDGESLPPAFLEMVERVPTVLDVFCSVSTGSVPYFSIHSLRDAQSRSKIGWFGYGQMSREEDGGAVLGILFFILTERYNRNTVREYKIRIPTPVKAQLYEYGRFFLDDLYKRHVRPLCMSLSTAMLEGGKDEESVVVDSDDGIMERKISTGQGRALGCIVLFQMVQHLPFTNNIDVDADERVQNPQRIFERPTSEEANSAVVEQLYRTLRDAHPMLSKELFLSSIANVVNATVGNPNESADSIVPGLTSNSGARGASMPADSDKRTIGNTYKIVDSTISELLSDGGRSGSSMSADSRKRRLSSDGDEISANRRSVETMNGGMGTRTELSKLRNQRDVCAKRKMDCSNRQAASMYGDGDCEEPELPTTARGGFIHHLHVPDTRKILPEDLFRGAGVNTVSLFVVDAPPTIEDSYGLGSWDWSTANWLAGLKDAGLMDEDTAIIVTYTDEEKGGAGERAEIQHLLQECLPGKSGEALQCSIFLDDNTLPGERRARGGDGGERDEHSWGTFPSSSPRVIPFDVMRGEGVKRATSHPSDPGKIEGAVNPFLITGSRICALETDDGGVLEHLKGEPSLCALNSPEVHSQEIDMYGEQRTLPGFNAALSILCRFALTGRTDTGVVVECDPGGVWGRACAELGLHFTGGQGTPAPKVHEPEAYMLYASKNLPQEKSLRTPVQAKNPSGMNFNLFMALSNIHGVGLFLDDDVSSQTELIQTVAPAIDFGAEEDSLRQEDYSPRRHIMKNDERGVFFIDWEDGVSNEHLATAGERIVNARYIMLINHSSEGNSSLVISECTQPPWDVQERTWYKLTVVTKEVLRKGTEITIAYSERREFE